MAVLLVCVQVRGVKYLHTVRQVALELGIHDHHQVQMFLDKICVAWFAVSGHVYV